MSKKRPLRCVVTTLVVAAVLLPIAACVVVAVSALLSSMGDVAGGAVLGRIALGLGIVWVIGLIVLVITGAARALVDDVEKEDPEIEE